MAWLACDADGTECIANARPYRKGGEWHVDMFEESIIIIPSGSIEKLIGRPLTWADEPVMI